MQFTASFTDLDLTQDSGRLHESVFSLFLVGLRLTWFSCCSQMFCRCHVGAPLQPMGTSVTDCELHLTIFHMCVQYVCVIRNVHVNYTCQDSLVCVSSVYHESCH